MGMKTVKSPGWEGIPPEFYTTFWHLLGQFLLAMINYSIVNGGFLKYVNLALLSVLPKPSKDLTLCCNYRPLSILTTEIKAFARILSSHLEPYMTKLVYCDQTGFIKSRLASDNMRRLLHVINAAKDITSPSTIFILDVEKA